MHTILDIVILNNNPCEYFATRSSRLFFPKISRLKRFNSAVIWLPDSQGTSQSSPNITALLRTFCPATDFEFSYVLLRKGSQNSRQTECSSWPYTKSVCAGFLRHKTILKQTSLQKRLKIPSGFGLNRSVLSFAALAMSRQLPTQLLRLKENSSLYSWGVLQAREAWSYNT